MIICVQKMYDENEYKSGKSITKMLRYSVTELTSCTVTNTTDSKLHIAIYPELLFLHHILSS